MTPDEARWWFEDYLDACNRHDRHAIGGMLHPEVRRAHLPSGAEAWLDDLGALFTGFPDLQWKRITVIVEGERLAAHLRVRGTHRGRFAGVAPTGRHVNAAEFGIYRVVAGRITEYVGTAGGADLLTQLRE